MAVPGVAMNYVVSASSSVLRQGVACEACAVTSSGNILVDLLRLWFLSPRCKKIFLKQTELVRLMVTSVTDTDLRPDTKANSAQKNAVGLSM